VSKSQQDPIAQAEIPPAPILSIEHHVMPINSFVELGPGKYLVLHVLVCTQKALRVPPNLAGVVNWTKLVTGPPIDADCDIVSIRHSPISNPTAILSTTTRHQTRKKHITNDSPLHERLPSVVIYSRRTSAMKPCTKVMSQSPPKQVTC
jgi:hypothetical protein